MTVPGTEARLLEILSRAESEGFLGPSDPELHVAHAVGFVDAARELGEVPDRFADLGTGGGVPGLVLALDWPAADAALIESLARRCRALEGWVKELDLEGRVEVLEGRGEVWAHDSRCREAFDLVTARSFGRPAVTGEIAAGLVRVGGLLVVSEPPEPAEDRWPDAAVERLGFERMVPFAARGAHYACLRKARGAEPGVPRATGRPAKRPLW